MKTKDLLSRYTAEDFREMLRTQTMLQLSHKWGCSTDVVRSAIRQLGLGKLRVDKAELLNRFSKQEWETLYMRHQYLIHKVAEELGCHKDTVSKILDELGIQKVHPTAQYTEEVRAKISAQAKVRPNRNLEKWVAQTPEWYKKGVVTRQTEGTYRRPHPKNRGVLDISEIEFCALVDFRGVLGAARHLQCSQSTIRARALKLGMELSSGAKKAMTQTPKFKEQQRQKRMSQPEKFVNTSIEVALQQALTKQGISFRLHEKVIGLTVPDILIGNKLVIYVDGCYWHGCPTCKIAKADRNDVNKNHDKFVNEGLRRAGYTVLRFWEHDIKDPEKLKECISKIEQAIHDSRPS